jgi:enediyne biosynthesis protein E4
MGLVIFVVWCVLLLVLAIPCSSQQPPAPQNSQSLSMGVSTGMAHAPVKDAQSRPITAGGFVDGAPLVFADITKQAGLDKFHHRSGTGEKKTIIDAPGSGVALIDYDSDG